VDGWKGINNSRSDSSIKVAKFDKDPFKWYIYEHYVYGERYWAEWESTGEMEENV